MKTVITLLVFCLLVISSPSKATDYIAFFDKDQKASEDPTPFPPEITDFGEEVLKLCGDWGSSVSAKAFAKTLKRSVGNRVLTQLRTRLESEDLVPDASKDTLAKILEKAWFGTNGFRHIFCGAPKKKKLGGLHYRGRYLQMQERGWGGIDPTCNRQKIDPPVFTIGLFYQRPDKSKGRSCVKGYSYSLDAEELFIEISIAYLRAYYSQPSNTQTSQSKSRKTVCRHKVIEDGNRYDAVFVAVPSGIITFYPIVKGAKSDISVCR